jgi:predicted alpha/beta superfamily hydrolase
MKYLITLSQLLFCIGFLQGQTLQVSTGRLIRIENFPSHFVQSRNIDVWLPENYTLHKKYSVLYMQDGQMLFNQNPINNSMDWRIDEILDSLMRTASIEDCIVVGIWRIEHYKMSEYFPEKIRDYLPSKYRKKMISNHQDSIASSNAYLKFLALELKPYIDKNFSVLVEKENTYIAGSGYGGLISMYTVCEYPEIFSSAASLSSFINNPDELIQKATMKYLKKNIPDPSGHKFYIDTWDNLPKEHYTKYQTKINALFKKKKYTDDRYFCLEYQQETPNETSWSNRLSIALKFLISNKMNNSLFKR